MLFAGIIAGAIGARFRLVRTGVEADLTAQDLEIHEARDQGDAGLSEEAHPQEHEEHADHDQEGIVRLPPGGIETYGIELATAGSGRLERTIRLPGEIRLNADRVAHIVPRVAGMVREVRKNLGDTVTPGELMAVLDSRELADAKAADLAAASRHALAKSNVERIEKLFARGIGPEQELLEVRQALAETDIDHRTAEAKLHALGLTQDQVEKLHDEADTDYSRYEIKAPFTGTVIEKHIALGEVVGVETSCFVFADLSDVWVDITVYPQDIAHVTVGRPVSVSAIGVTEAQRGEISYVSPRIDERSRTGMARVVLPNPDGRWKPGTFVRADLAVSAEDVRVLVPSSALQSVENESVVFVAEHGEFTKRVVNVGRHTDSRSEILTGLEPGEVYAATGTFILKAELGKAEAEHAH